MAVTNMCAVGSTKPTRFLVDEGGGSHTEKMSPGALRGWWSHSEQHPRGAVDVAGDPLWRVARTWL